MQQTYALAISCLLLTFGGQFAPRSLWAVERSETTDHAELPLEVAACQSNATPASCLGIDLRDGLLSGWIPESDHRNSGFLDFNYYWDNRDFNVLTINAGAKLPCQFEYFQFVNYTSPFGAPSELEDWNDFFTEIHLRRPIAAEHRLLGQLDWNLMWADGGFTDEVGRFGVRWRLHDTAGPIGDFVTDTLKLSYSLTFHVLEDDGSGWQIEHVFRRDFFEGLMYVAGFADHNVNDGFDDSDWVAESQWGVKLGGNLYAVAEYRYNSFLPARVRSGWGFGIEYFVPLQ
ncbi:hypothetical protein CKO51_00430 [Rhodopirellula sp. SM50]|nr:hypothetical protein [Rhodopirellula sp. SM50]PAY21570.1 hypothetical protein CKO51_00430 [Rhodopirellula sp. SM50]